jgi:nucleoside-diphosphate-sugar epimerase
MSGKHVVIAGASGLVGYAAMKHFAAVEGCKVTALSRRIPEETYGARVVSSDLQDGAACAALAAELGDATHLVYAALHERPNLISGWLEAEQIETNDAMLRNLLAPLLGSAKGLRHVTLLQGTKAYGAHVAPFSLPAREDRDEARHVPNFYWRQEDYLRGAQAGAGWSFSILRPQIIFGQSIGSAMNLIPALGVYGALLKDRGEPLHFPGGSDSILEAVDADLLARVIAWAGEAEAAMGQAFNVTNGDVFVWRNVWPAIADALGMAVGEDRSASFARMADEPESVAAWDRIRDRYGLKGPGLADYVGASMQYADFCLAVGSNRPPGAALVSTVKLRRAGFGEALDSEAMFRRWFALFQAQRLLPPPN